MNLSTDVSHELGNSSRQREHICRKAIIGFIYLKMNQQSEERYEYVVIYDLVPIFGPNRLYTAPFKLQS